MPVTQEQQEALAAQFGAGWVGQYVKAVDRYEEIKHLRPLLFDGATRVTKYGKHVYRNVREHEGLTVNDYVLLAQGGYNQFGGDATKPMCGLLEVTVYTD